MSVRNLTRWTRAAGATELHVSYAVYTPNGPAFVEPLWDAIDAVLSRVSPLHVLSVMFCLHGKK
jgi:hypothetical protein